MMNFVVNLMQKKKNIKAIRFKKTGDGHNAKWKKQSEVRLDEAKDTVKGDTLGTNKTVFVDGKWIVIKHDSREIPLNKSEENFLIRSLKKMVKEIS